MAGRRAGLRFAGVEYRIIQEVKDSDGKTPVSSVYWCSDLKNKWAVSLSGDMWKTVVAEFGRLGWDAKVHPCATRFMPAYGTVVGPTPVPAAGYSFNGWGQYVKS
jgi:hypothetical protein